MKLDDGWYWFQSLEEDRKAKPPEMPPWTVVCVGSGTIASVNGRLIADVEIPRGYYLKIPEPFALGKAKEIRDGLVPPRDLADRGRAPEPWCL